MLIWFILLAQIVLLALLLHLFIKRKYSYWASKGVIGPKPSLAKMGNFSDLFAGDSTIIERNMVQKYGRIHGIYYGFQPVLTIADPELVKKILIKDFNLFINTLELRTYHELANEIIFLGAQGDKWKRLRMITSPCFSSGRLNAMNQSMDRSVATLSSYFTKLDNGIVKDTRQVMVGFTLSVIASNVFGIETESNVDSFIERSRNPFLKNALNLMQVSGLTSMASFTFPLWLNNALGIRHFFDVESFDFFINLAKEMVAKRRNAIGSDGQRLKRNDLLDLLIDAQDEGDKSAKGRLTENEIIAQAIGFMIGGFDTAAATLAHIAWELAKNPAIQTKLYNEVQKALDGIVPGSEEYYEVVNQRIPYLEAVIKEALRKYPPFPRTSRLVDHGKKEGYQLGNLHLEPNQMIEVSILGMHYDPEFFPEPDKFNPDRFMSENKDHLVPYAYLPFGAGPRNCLGLRFAMQEMKLCLARLATEFRFETTRNTPEKLTFLPYNVILNTGPFEIRVDKR